MCVLRILPLLSYFLTAKSSLAPTHLLVNRVGPCYDVSKTIVTTSEFGITTQTYESSLSGELNISENVTDGWKIKVTMQKCVDIRNIDSCDYFRSFYLVRDGCSDEDDDEHYTILFHYADPTIECPVQAGHYKIFNYPIFTEDNYLTVYESKISTSVFGYTFRLDGFTVDNRKIPSDNRTLPRGTKVIPSVAELFADFNELFCVEAYLQLLYMREHDWTGHSDVKKTTSSTIDTVDNTGEVEDVDDNNNITTAMSDELI